LEEIAMRGSQLGAVLLIDESASPYLGPRGSAVQLINKVDNLIVLRGFTKAYSWGGLRAAFAIASVGVAQHVRELVAPLQVSELALQAALRILSAGDIFGRLRKRIRMMKPTVIESLEKLGLEVIGRREDLPWVAVSDAEEVASRLFEKCGICALRPATALKPTEQSGKYLRLTIPLSQERMALFQRLLDIG
jgi:histidinol-phosphate/aromatic aminotransferase/cobyric acid decarboxylase-like protein